MSENGFLYTSKILAKLEGVAKDLGFENVLELNQLVASIDVSTPEKLASFRQWQMNDGTKSGLIKLKGETNA